jgi:glycerol-3-phosphate dehydrogenase
MRKIDTDVLVIGGGATGAGVVRDLAMRGFRTVLVEKRDLSHGTTGRYHGLLHSGGRYVVKDPLAAIECIRENQVLRKIMPHCLEDTGGFFVLTPVDDLAYAPKFMDGCLAKDCCREISITRMLKEEPLLNPGILRCFRVPDAAADSFLATEVNAESARQYGAQIFNYHELRGLTGRKPYCWRTMPGRCEDEDHIFADMVVNAAGAWAV